MMEMEEENQEEAKMALGEAVDYRVYYMTWLEKLK